MNGQWATLRGLLASPPSQKAVEQLCVLLEKWSFPEEIPLVLDYLEQHLAGMSGFSFDARHACEWLPSSRALGVLPPESLGWKDLSSCTLDMLMEESDTRALSVLRSSHIAMYPEAKENYEAQIAFDLTISHPNILATRRAFLDEAQQYSVLLEHVDGPSLRHLVPFIRAMQPAERIPFALAVMLQVSEALVYAHSRKHQGPDFRPLLHMRLMPENVLIRRDGTAKLANFGLELALSEIHYTGKQSTPTRYFAPEQIAGSSVLSPAVDVFLAGVLLAELLTGYHPFQGTSELDTLRRIHEGHYHSFRTTWPALPPALEDLLSQALLKEPSMRLDSMRSFWQVLSDLYNECVDETPTQILRDLTTGILRKERLLTKLAIDTARRSPEPILAYYWGANPACESARSLPPILPPVGFFTDEYKYHREHCQAFFDAATTRQ